MRGTKLCTLHYSITAIVNVPHGPYTVNHVNLLTAKYSDLESWVWIEWCIGKLCSRAVLI